MSKSLVRRPIDRVVARQIDALEFSASDKRSQGIVKCAETARESFTHDPELENRISMIGGGRMSRQIIENFAFHLLDEQFMLIVRHGMFKGVRKNDANQEVQKIQLVGFCCINRLGRREPKKRECPGFFCGDWV
jgi:hypothetical protein